MQIKSFLSEKLCTRSHFETKAKGNSLLTEFSSTVSWLLLSEIFPAGITGRAFSIVTVLNWGTNLLVSLTFLDMLSKYSGRFGQFRSPTPHPYWRTITSGTRSSWSLWSVNAKSNIRKSRHHWNRFRRTLLFFCRQHWNFVHLYFLRSDMHCSCTFHL